jgi:hypothetical protein
LFFPKDFDCCALPYARAQSPDSGKKARRLERQNWVVRKSTTATTVHGKAARADEAQLCSVVHATTIGHYRDQVGSTVIAHPAGEKISMSFTLASAQRGALG